jgi:uncharacterized protein (DUF302 family)
VDRLLNILKTKGVQVFAAIDQAAEARKVGLELRETVLVIFGNPRAGTPVMDDVPLSGLDLPLKVLIWDNDGQTMVSYYSSDTIAQRFGLSSSLRANLAAIDTITESLVVD